MWLWIMSLTQLLMVNFSHQFAFQVQRIKLHMKTQWPDHETTRSNYHCVGIFCSWWHARMILDWFFLRINYEFYDKDGSLTSRAGVSIWLFLFIPPKLLVNSTQQQFSDFPFLLSCSCGLALVFCGHSLVLSLTYCCRLVISSSCSLAVLYFGESLEIPFLFDKQSVPFCITYIYVSISTC